MCGIVGYIGKKPAEKMLLEGLEKLSYRGYDSAGIAVINSENQIQFCKKAGKLPNLKEALDHNHLEGRTGIGHTRWATHGEPSDRNAHPHMDGQGKIAVVHNGIIENYDVLRKKLEAHGEVLISDTDTEVIAHLLHQLYCGDMKQALQQIQKMVEGSYAIGVLCSYEPDKLFCMKKDSPLIMGLSEGGGFLASDIPALLNQTRDVMILEDNEIGVLTEKTIEIYDKYGNSCKRHIYHVEWEQESTEKEDFPHYMLKEIHEQPKVLQKTLAAQGEVWENDWSVLDAKKACEIQRVTLVGCGTAYHAALYGKYVLQQLTQIPAEAEVSSEYRYMQSSSILNEMVIAISQSGETADTLAALRKAKMAKAEIRAVCNVTGSSIAREAGENQTLYTVAGPEIAVASTKAYMAQMEMMLLISLGLGYARKTLSMKSAEEIYQSLAALPEKALAALELQRQIQKLAQRRRTCRHVIFAGRGLDYAVAMEAALKLKEVSYIFSEAYPAGELKHGPIALVQPESLFIGCITQPQLMNKMIANMQEIKARGAEVIAVCPEKMASEVAPFADETIVIPDTNSWLSPLLAIIPLQLFAYYMAVENGCDVDQPRNLAKSVTVE